jgi:methionyl-tRNA formyltransferase
VRLIFFGTPDFAASILEHLVSTTKHEILVVVSKPDAVKGRGQQLMATPVKQAANRLLPEVPVFQPVKASASESVAYLNAFQPDACVVVAYGEILKQALLEVPRKGSFNIHASLLPAYRGAAPIQRALMGGCRKSGVTIFRLAKALDSGDIVWQESCAVGPNMTSGELTEDLLEIAKRGVVEVLEGVENASLTPQHQLHEEATFAPKIERQDLVLDSSQDILLIHDRIRALSPQPGAFFSVMYHDQIKRLKVFRSHIDATQLETHNRWCKTSQGFLALATLTGTLVLDVVQFEGRSVMSLDIFLRGVPLSEIMFL